MLKNIFKNTVKLEYGHYQNALYKVQFCYPHCSVFFLRNIMTEEKTDKIMESQTKTIE